jgi:hypothetical protein
MEVVEGISWSRTDLDMIVLFWLVFDELVIILTLIFMVLLMTTPDSESSVGPLLVRAINVSAGNCLSWVSSLLRTASRLCDEEGNVVAWPGL